MLAVECQNGMLLFFFLDNEFKEQGELVSIVQDLADGDTSSLGNFFQYKYFELQIFLIP